MSHLTQRTAARRLGAGVVVAALLVVTPFATAKKKKYVPYTVVPAIGDPKSGGGPDKVEIHRAGVTAEISYVTAMDRRRMMSATLEKDFDPFATPADQEPFFHTFLVTLENTSSRELLFNPSASRVLTDHHKMAYAIDYTALYQGIGRASGLTMDEIHQIAFDRTVTLRPGGKTRKLLVFEQWIGKWDGFTLGISLEADGLSVVELSVPFRKQLMDPGGGR